MNRFTLRLFAWLAIAVMLVTSMLATPAVVHSASISVTTTKDENGTEAVSQGCSLREAIIAVNTRKAYGGCPGGNAYDTIFLPPGDYKLTRPGADEKGGDLDITRSMTIIGAGTTSFIQGAAGFNDRIFHVRTLPGEPTIQVILSSMRISGGFVSSHPGGGGVLNERANLTLYRVWIDGNSVSSSTFGGGVTNLSGSTLTVDTSTFFANSGGYGGAIYNGGILKLSHSALVANLAHQTGGGLDNNPADKVSEYAEITNTTIAKNVSLNSGAGVSNAGRLTIYNATIADNTGAGLWLFSGNLVIYNTLLAGNKEKGDCVVTDAYTGTFVSGGYNLIENTSNPEGLASCPFDSIKDLLNISANLTDNLLQYGMTKTMAYGFKNDTSPAIDGVAADGYCPVTDQGLHKRPVDGIGNEEAKCDIGAVEHNGTISSFYIPILQR
jgi:CSLREA domain-containing protein